MRRPADNYTIRRRMEKSAARKAAKVAPKKPESLQDFCISLLPVLERLRPVAQIDPKAWKHDEDLELVRLYARTGDLEATALAISRKVMPTGVACRLSKIRRLYG